MSPKKMSAAAAMAAADAKAAKHLARAREEQHRASVYLVSCVLKNRAELAASVINHLKTMGVDVDAVAQEDVAQSPFTPTRFAQPVSSGDSESRSLDSAKARVEDSELVADDLAKSWNQGSVLSTCYVEVSILSVKLMKAMLKVSEPIAASDHAIRALAPPGKKMIPKSVMLEVFEYVYGLARDESILAVLHAPGAFQKYLDILNVRRGRLFRDLQLPPDWASRGVYSTIPIEEKVMVKCRIVEGQRELLGDLMRGVDIQTVHVQMNWSAKSALICDGSGALRAQAILLFPEVASSTAVAMDEVLGQVKQEAAATSSVCVAAASATDDLKTEGVGKAEDDKVKASGEQASIKAEEEENEGEKIPVAIKDDSQVAPPPPKNVAELLRMPSVSIPAGIPLESPTPTPMESETVTGDKSEPNAKKAKIDAEVQGANTTGPASTSQVSTGAPAPKTKARGKAGVPKTAAKKAATKKERSGR